MTGSVKLRAVLLRIGMVLAMVVPTLYAVGLLLAVWEILSAGEAGEAPHTTTDVVVGGIMLLVTGYLGVSVCVVERPSLLRTARVVALGCLSCTLVFGIVGSVSELLLNVYIESWLESTLVFVPLFLFYQEMMRRKMRRR